MISLLPSGGQKPHGVVTPRAPFGRAIWVPGLVLSALAVLLRLLVASRREGIEIDGITYLENARALWHDWRAIDVLHPPLYSVLLAPVLGLWSDAEWGARVLSAVLGGLWVWPTLWLAQETTEEQVPWTAGLLVAVMPAAIEASTRVLAEAAFGLCLIAFLAALAHSLRAATLGWAGLAGALGGLASLGRPEGMSYLVLAWILLALAPVLFGKPWTTRLVLTRITAVTVLWLTLMFPYMALVRNHTGHWHWSGKMGFTLGWSDSVGEEQPSAFIERYITETRPGDAPQSLLADVVARPGAAVRRVAFNLHHLDKYVFPSLLHSAGIALVFLGLTHLRFRRAPGPPEWLLAAAPLPLAGLLLFLVGPRYFVSAIPVLSIIAGIGLARLGRREDSDAPSRVGMPAMVLLAIVVLSFLPWIIRPWFRPDPTAVEKAAGLWLRRSAGPGTVFIGTYGRIAYYAEARGILFGGRSLEELLAEGHKAGARFLIADNLYLPASRPDLLALVAGEPGKRRDLELAHVVEDRAGNRVVIYRLRSGPGPS